jgi:hypothetical protein
MRKVVLSREGEELFNGYIVDYSYNFNLGGLDTVSVACADDFYLLSQTYMDEFNVSEELANVRIEAVLDLPEVNAFQLPGQRNLETSTILLGGAAAYTVPNGTSVAAYMAKINESVQGRIFCSRDGVFTFQDRVGDTLSASAADFHDDGTAIPYDNVGISFEANQVINRASVTHAGASSPEIAEDLTSQATYFIQTTAISDALVHNDAAALDLANYLLVGQPEARYTNVSTPVRISHRCPARHCGSTGDRQHGHHRKVVYKRRNDHIAGTRISHRGHPAPNRFVNRPPHNPVYIAYDAGL